jgi:hypothetical protein
MHLPLAFLLVILFLAFVKDRMARCPEGLVSSLVQALEDHGMYFCFLIFFCPIAQLRSPRPRIPTSAPPFSLWFFGLPGRHVWRSRWASCPTRPPPPLLRFSLHSPIKQQHVSSPLYIIHTKFYFLRHSGHGLWTGCQKPPTLPLRPRLFEPFHPIFA